MLTASALLALEQIGPLRARTHQHNAASAIFGVRGSARR
jgi:hypothetical protein